MSEPLSNSTPEPQHEPALNLPAAIIWSLAVLLLIHAGGAMVMPGGEAALVSWFGFVPARLTLWLAPARLDEVAAEMAARTDLSLAGAAWYLKRLFAHDGPRLWTALSYTLLHASWLHLLSNLVWLAAFGSPVARRLGAARFFILAGLAGAGGALLHWWSRPFDFVPVIGASAIVAGVTAAAIRFAFAPGVGFIGMADDRAVRALPAEPLVRIWRNRSAMLFVLIWFALNFLFGSGIVPIFGEDASIAWEAHIGGFLVGLFGFSWLDRGAVWSGRSPS